MRKSFMREKKVYCGKKYLEVDIYPYTYNQEEVNRRGKRSRKVKLTEPKQRNLNEKNAKRYFIQFVNTNFGEGDIHLTLTYKTKYLPVTVEDGEREVRNYLRRLKREIGKEGLEFRYVLVTESVTAKDSTVVVRLHHHIIMNAGLDRDKIEGLWSKGRGKSKESIGYANADRLQTDENGAEALCRYLTKFANRKKRWSSSKNLKKPESRTNDFKYSRREVDKIIKNPFDLEYWENKYRGYTLCDKGDYSIKTEYNELTGWAIYLKLRRKE